LAREPDLVLPLWPGTPPGATRAREQEHQVEGRPRLFYQLTDITTPSPVVFHAPAEKRNGTAVLVCPGGALGKIQPGEPGRHEAASGELGTITFELK
jgi:hypothetical protein